ncbi:PREDICTED: uncharacterized protein LOC104591251 [Nelumbo nucifera]|uniref:Uncharacterized protein n=2 Tax=Nelumbo nucifera TaxID=4432 RepID=A0A822ZTL5_NELNU|nr:PREDICTED: uncharacterized protein LOC104591251 [Nelumbo nucifera]DAD48217.1 TPA_asm: hypothetical protein HUJ06_018154 [Nelumbo nucifera]
MASIVTAVNGCEVALSSADGGGYGARPATLFRRRGFLLSVMFAPSTAAVAAPQVNDSRTELLQRYLKKSKENRAKNEKERLDDYYKRNYKDYFEFLEGSIKAKKDKLSEAEKGILDWLQTNK